MEIRLDLSTEQLAYLDKDLTALLKELTDEQKIEIIKAYMQSKFKDWETLNYYGSPELSNFAKGVMEGLQEKINEAITKDILEDEKMVEVINDITKNVKENMGKTICEGITHYIASNLFNSKEDVEDQINRNLMERNHNNYSW